jgi:hypothetical protein
MNRGVLCIMMISSSEAHQCLAAGVTATRFIGSWNNKVAHTSAMVNTDLYARVKSSSR